MYSVDQYLKSVRNLQTKCKLLTWLRLQDAAHSNIGLFYSDKAYQKVYIY